MSNLIEIQGQIEKLQRQASEIRAREFDKTVQEILVKMSVFGITLKDIQTGKIHNTKKTNKTSTTREGLRNKAKRNREVTSTVVPAKYRGPDGKTWSGRGLTPRWLAALITQGRVKEEFAIKS